MSDDGDLTIMNMDIKFPDESFEDELCRMFEERKPEIIKLVSDHYRGGSVVRKLKVKLKRLIYWFKQGSKLSCLL